MSGTEFGPPTGPEELQRHSEILSWSFAFERDDLAAFVERVGAENLRLFREGGRASAVLTLIPMAQWFGGRSVPMTGVNLVGTAPEARGRGVATRMMIAAVREMRKNGVPISTLYPAKQTLYRRAEREARAAAANKED